MAKKSRSAYTKPSSLPAMVLFVQLFLTLTTQPTTANYCDHNLCAAAEQYCCGDNICCDYPNSWWSWYVWVSLLIVIGVSSVLWGCIRLLCFEQQGPGLLFAGDSMTKKKSQLDRYDTLCEA